MVDEVLLQVRVRIDGGDAERRELVRALAHHVDEILERAQRVALPGAFGRVAHLGHEDTEGLRAALTHREVCHEIPDIPADAQRRRVRAEAQGGVAQGMTFGLGILAHAAMLSPARMREQRNPT